LCVGYRLLTPDGMIAFFPDTESQADVEDGGMIEFVRDADALILDAQYDADEYKSHIGWGHGCIDDTISLGLKARARHLYLFHHDPDHDDKKVDSLVKKARRIVAREKSKMKVDAAREGMTIRLGTKSSR